MRHRRTKLLALTAVLLGVAVAVPALVLADSTATTSGATSVTSTSAMLHGVVNTTFSDGFWAFQYGPTTAYGHTTTPQAVGSGTTAVAVTVTGLTPATLYHFRLIEADDQTSGPGGTRHPHYGNDLTFITASSGGGGGGGGYGPPYGTPGAKYGKASLKSHSLKYSHGKIAVPMRCAGVSSAKCSGRISLTTRGKHRKSVSCGSGKFSAGGGHSRVVKVSPSGGCKALLKKAKHHKIKATFKATYTTHQNKQSVGVTITGH